MPSEPRTAPPRPAARRLRPGRHWLPQLAAACCGLLLVPAFPPEGWWWLAPLSVAGLSLSARAAERQRVARGRRRPAVAAAWTGWWYGVGFCVLMFYWVTAVGTDAWIIVGILEGLYFIPLGAALAAVGRLRGAPLWQALLWVADEAARDRWPLGGFPWGRLAFSQSHTPLTPLAALGGAPLVTFATALVGTVLAAVVLTAWRSVRRAPKLVNAAPVNAAPVVGAPVVAASAVAASNATPAPGRAIARPVAFAAGWVALAVALPVVGLLVPIQTTAGKPVQLAAIQGDVPRTGLDAYGQAAAVLDNHLAVTEQYAEKVAAGQAPQPAAVFWPEDSDDVDPFTDPAVSEELTAAAAGIHTQILVGTVVAVGATQARNEAIVWDPVTGPGAVYVKRHLVPFGEYIPFRSVLTKYFSELSLVPRDFIPGDKPGVLTVGGVRIADVICFEVADDTVVRQAVHGGGGVIVIQTNNATYGWTGQPEQQLAISQLRAVESGRPVMIAATSGISGYITPDGNVHQETRQFTPAVVAALVTPRYGLTLADRVGYWPELAMSAAALVAWALALVTGRRRAPRAARAAAAPAADLAVDNFAAKVGVNGAGNGVANSAANGAAPFSVNAADVDAAMDSAAADGPGAAAEPELPAVPVAAVPDVVAPVGNGADDGVRALNSAIAATITASTAPAAAGAANGTIPTPGPTAGGEPQTATPLPARKART